MIRLLFNYIAIGCAFAGCLGTSTAWADRAEDDYRVGAFHYSRGEWTDAHEALKSFLDQHPGHKLTGSVHFYQGEILVQLKRHAEAIRSYTDFLSLEPNHKQAAHAEFRIAECYHLSGKLEAAERAFKLFQDRHPDHPIGNHVHPYLAEIAQASADWDNALGHFQTALEVAGSDEERGIARLGIARAYSQQEKWSEARTAYRELAATISGLTHSIVCLERGILEFNTKNYQAAVSHLEKVSQLHAGPRGEADLWTAKAYYQTRDWAAAERYLRKAQDAEKLANQVEEIDYLLARTLFEQRRLEEAETAFQRHLNEHAESRRNEAAKYFLLLIQIQREESESVHAAVDRLRREHPEGSYRSRAELATAKFFQRRDDHEVVLELLKETDEAERPEHRQRRYLIAISQLALGYDAEALKTLEILVQQENADSYSAGARLMLGRIYLRQQNWIEAVRHLEEMSTLKLSPEIADQGRCLTIVAMAELGQVQEARERYRELDRERVDARLYLDTTRQLAEIAFRKESIPWATELFQLLAKEQNPSEFIEQGLAGLAWCQVTSSHAEDSEATIAELTRRYPDSPLLPAVLLIQAKSLEGPDPPRAIGMYRRLLEEEPQPEDKYRANAALRLVALLEQTGQKEEAIAVYQQLLADPIIGLNTDELTYRQAWCHFDLQDWDAAQTKFLELHQRSPQSSYWGDATYRLAEIAMTRQDQAEAVEYLDTILARENLGDITNYARYMRGHIAIGNGDWETVARQMDRLSESSSDEPLRSMAAYWAGEAQFKQGEFEAARQRLERLVSDNLGRDLTTNQVAKLRLAQIAANLDDWEDARHRAERLIEDHPEFDQRYEVDYLIGRCDARQAKFSSARQAYGRVVQSERGRTTETAAMAQWMIGETYFHQHDYPAAIRAYAKVGALYNYPHWKAAALLQIGKCHEAQEQWSEAAGYYREITEDFAESTYAADAELRLSVVRQRERKADGGATPTNKLR
ncbi:MAG: tetratricopeptide repeat protein [Pirellulaceae bacterium]